MDKFKTKDGKEAEVTAQGSLALLAIGYRGLIAWRKKRMEEQAITLNSKLQTLNPPPNHEA
jgi:hypothetical protein